METPIKEKATEIITTLAHKRKIPRGWKKRRRGRPARMASVADKALLRRHVASPTSLPVNEIKDKSQFTHFSQYETTVRRRAIRKENTPEPLATAARGTPLPKNVMKPLHTIGRKAESMLYYDEEIGDTSLGMKLNILGGRVIVQNINSLSDGRASPAQLTGVIQRGDVLLAIDGKSIVNLPLDQLVIGLQPLSTPMEDGTYKRILRLRFAAGDGLSALDSNDKLLSKAPTESGVFNLTQFLPQDFPIVDNLSGQPLFGDSLIATVPVKSPIKEEPNSNLINSTNILTANEIVSNPQFVGIKAIKRSLSFHEHISLEISESFQKEKSCLISEYFAWSDNYSELLRPPQRTSMLARDVVIDYWRKMKDLLEQGQNVINGSKALMDTLEDIDKGKDVRSFQVWSSNASLRSRATTRRRYVLDTASLMASTIAEELDSDAGVSVGSDELDDLDGIDGDELLVQLAAHDEIWRKQVLETIAKATKEMEEDESEKENCNSNDLDIAEKLGNLLLGEQVNKLLMKKKKSFALPQDDVTCVLFDLVSYLASTTPDEISMKGKFEVNPQTRLVPFQKSRGSSSNNDPILAAIFVVHDVFPAWLACFKPLPWEERRVLWPHTKATSNSNIGVESVADDLLTVDSPGTSPIPNRKKKNLRETIEDMELDVESRAETCFLITFYFTQEILPGMVGDRGISRVAKPAWTETQALDFLDKFGAYLRLPMSIAYAAFLESMTILEKLLELAKHDPRHLEAMKEVSKTDSLLLYETTMLSAIIQQIGKIELKKPEERIHLIHLAVSAYPDLRPWILRNACIEKLRSETEIDEFKGLYYTYLSLLLHPCDGHEGARKDIELVKEWCRLSLNSNGENSFDSDEKRENFYQVASRKKRDYHLYRRDLPFLVDIAVNVSDVQLAIDLMDELLDSKNFFSDERLFLKILEHVRRLSQESVSVSSLPSSKPLDTPVLKQAISLYEKLFSSQVMTEKYSISLHKEYEALIFMTCPQGRGEVISLIASSANPLYSLQTLKSLSRDVNFVGMDMVPFLQQTLYRSAILHSKMELSPTILRLKGETHDVNNSPEKCDGLWRLLKAGKLQVDK